MPGPKVVKVLKFSKSGNHRPQVKKVTVVGNMRLAAGGTLKRARRKRDQPQEVGAAALAAGAARRQAPRQRRDDAELDDEERRRRRRAARRTKRPDVAAPRRLDHRLEREVAGDDAEERAEHQQHLDAEARAALPGRSRATRKARTSRTAPTPSPR